MLRSDKTLGKVEEIELGGESQDQMEGNEDCQTAGKWNGFDAALNSRSESGSLVLSGCFLSFSAGLRFSLFSFTP